MATIDIAFHGESAGVQTARTHAPVAEHAEILRGLAVSSIAVEGKDSSPSAAATEIRVLMIEDDPVDVELALRAMRIGVFAPIADVVQTPEEFSRLIHTTAYDIIFADYNLPSWNGMEAIELLRKEGLDIPVILITGALGEVKAVECIHRGAADYILKENLARLPESARRALRERELREQNRKSQEELARSNRDLEQFAYVASHDLQEPLRMVATYTQLLAERYKGKLDENADKYIHYAVDGALRMQTLVQDLLAFSRIDPQRDQLDCIDTHEVLLSALKNLESSIQESGARITWEALPCLQGKRSQLAQVFQNLVGNAIKFRGSNPPAIHVSAACGTKEYTFSVADNGLGIAPDCLEPIFEIFKRLHTRAEHPGNGIGLAICKKIVEQHGGRIWAESQPGQGSIFRFTLPRTHQSQKNGERYDSADENRA